MFTKSLKRFLPFKTCTNKANVNKTVAEELRFLPVPQVKSFSVETAFIVILFEFAVDILNGTKSAWVKR